MEKNKSEIIVTGNYHYYPINEVAEDILKIIRRKSFSKQALEMLKKYFSVVIKNADSKK